MRLLPKDCALGWTPYVWLVYHSLLYIDPLFSDTSALTWTLTLMSTAVFLPVYFWAYWLHGRRVLIPVSVFVLLGTLFFSTNLGASGFFIYAAAFLGDIGRPGVAFRYLVALVVYALVAGLLLEAHVMVIGVAVIFSLVVGGANIHFAEAERARARLKLAQTEVERLATLAERERIARDLHDLLGHTLSVITLKSELAAKLVRTDAIRAEAEIREVESISRDALSEVRKAVEGYRFARLGAELSRAKVALGTAGIDLDVETRPFSLSSDEENATALALRECITNVVRHSRADRCNVSYSQTDGSFRLVVTDNGEGGEPKEGSGIQGMRERIEAFGGTLMADGSKGMRVEIVLPQIAPSRQAAERAS